jgi:hypothetical protein
MTLMVASKADRAEARRLQRLAARGELRRLYRGIYTDDLERQLEAVARGELYVLCALVAPGSVVSHRSALESRPTPAGSYFLTGSYRRDIELPGITLRIVEGPGPLESDTHLPTLHGDIHISSQARALLENLTRSHGSDPAERRTLGVEGVERRVDQIMSRSAQGTIDQIRDDARAIAPQLGLEAEFERLDNTIGAMLGTRKAPLRASTALARARGRPYDADRVELFDVLLAHLHEHPLEVPPADPAADRQIQAFAESYFSNFIEGTEFELEEAFDIVIHGQPLQYREDDSHDILGTYRAILESVSAPEFPDSFERFVERLRHWNRQVIESRQARQPGEIKAESNRVGTYVLVEPGQVLGTLEKGYERIMAAPTPGARSALAMFVVAEVHPFQDGNGRTARLAMNCALSQAGLTRIIIPTVYRDDYLSALRALSLRDGRPAPLVRMLARAARFSRGVDFHSQATCFESLREANALMLPDDAKLRIPGESHR